MEFSPTALDTSRCLPTYFSSDSGTTGPLLTLQFFSQNY